METQLRLKRLNKPLILGLILSFGIYFTSSIYLPLGLLLLVSILIILNLSKYYSLSLYTYSFTVFFQNAFIAYSAYFIPSKNVFNILHGFNFLISLLVFLLLLLRLGKLKKKDMQIIGLSGTVLILLIIYAILGTYLYGLKNSLAYFRLFAIPILMLWIGYFFSHYLRPDVLKKILWWLYILTLISIVGQFFFHEIFILLMNDVAYYGFKRDTDSIDEVISYLHTNSYFNISGLGQAMRAPGLIKSFISSAYFLLLLSIVQYWNTKKHWVYISVIIIAVCVASKGAILAFFFFVFYIILTEKFKINLKTSVFLFAFLWIIVIIIGFNLRNEHMLGFSGGLSYLWTFGNGLGFGGNLSDMLILSYRGEMLPDLGYFTRFQNGSESALGVLFSSLGIFSFIYVFAILYIIYVIYIKFKNTPLNHLSILCLVMFFQGIFQEEAYSPYAFGLVMFIGGFYYKCLSNAEIIPKN